MISKTLIFFSGCAWFGGVGTLSGLGEIYTITCIAYERCRAISSPLRRLNNSQVGDLDQKIIIFHLFSSFSQINLLIMGSWLISLGFAILPLVDIGAYVTDVSLKGPQNLIKSEASGATITLQVSEMVQMDDTLQFSIFFKFSIFSNS